MGFVFKSTHRWSSKFQPSSFDEVLSNWFSWKFCSNVDIRNNVVVVLLCITLSIEYPVVYLCNFIGAYLSKNFFYRCSYIYPLCEIVFQKFRKEDMQLSGTEAYMRRSNSLQRVSVFNRLTHITILLRYKDFSWIIITIPWLRNLIRLFWMVLISSLTMKLFYKTYIPWISFRLSNEHGKKVRGWGYKSASKLPKKGGEIWFVVYYKYMFFHLH